MSAENISYGLVILGIWWLAVTSIGAANWGVRYVLPVYALLFVLAGGLAPRLWNVRRRAVAWQLPLALLRHSQESKCDSMSDS